MTIAQCAFTTGTLTPVTSVFL